MKIFDWGKAEFHKTFRHAFVHVMNIAGVFLAIWAIQLVFENAESGFMAGVVILFFAYKLMVKTNKEASHE